MLQIKTPSKSIRIYAQLPRTRTLGPFLRFALWVQGCNGKCPGCMTPDAKPHDQGQLIDLASLARDICLDFRIEGLTISGGEPFLQAGALSLLIDQVRMVRDMGVIIYTGLTIEELYQDNHGDVLNLLERTDLLIDGPYLRELDDGLSLRGSSNQTVRFLTNRYVDIAKKYYAQSQRNVELHILKNEVFLAGIPGSEMLKRWKNRQLI